MMKTDSVQNSGRRKNSKLVGASQVTAAVRSKMAKKSPVKIPKGGAGLFSPEKKHLRFVLANANYSGKHLDHYIHADWLKKNTYKDFNREELERISFRYRKIEKPPRQYLKIRDEIYELLTKLDVNNSEHVKALKEYVHYHYIRTCSSVQDMIFAACVVYTEWDKDFGVELYATSTTLYTLSKLIVGLDAQGTA
jgi:hypothetical protein